MGKRNKEPREKRPLRWPVWSSYLLGVITGIPMLVSGLRYEDDIKAFHGAQAVVFGLITLIGGVLVRVALHFVLPFFGFETILRGTITLVCWVVLYGWYLGTLLFWILCMTLTRQGRNKITPWLTERALDVEDFFARFVRVRV